LKINISQKIEASKKRLRRKIDDATDNAVKYSASEFKAIAQQSSSLPQSDIDSLIDIKGNALIVYDRPARLSSFPHRKINGGVQAQLAPNETRFINKAYVLPVSGDVFIWNSGHKLLFGRRLSVVARREFPALAERVQEFFIRQIIL